MPHNMFFHVAGIPVGPYLVLTWSLLGPFGSFRVLFGPYLRLKVFVDSDAFLKVGDKGLSIEALEKYYRGNYKYSGLWA